MCVCVCGEEGGGGRGELGLAFAECKHMVPVEGVVNKRWLHIMSSNISINAK